MATEEQQLKKAEEEKEAASLENWMTLGVQRQFISFVRVAGNGWDGNDMWHITSNGLRCSRIEDNMASVRSVKPFRIMDSPQRRFYYFEVEIKQVKSTMWIGMSAGGFPITSNKAVGDCSPSFGISQNGTVRISGKDSCMKLNGQTFGKDDVIGCGLLRLARGCHRAFYTKNGQIWGTPIRVSYINSYDIYPTISSDSVYDAVEANFGDSTEVKKTFLFDFSGINVIDAETSDQEKKVETANREKKQPGMHKLAFGLLKRTFPARNQNN